LSPGSSICTMIHGGACGGVPRGGCSVTLKSHFWYSVSARSGAVGSSQLSPSGIQSLVIIFFAISLSEW
jgi:hypothetical protein